MRRRNITNKHLQISSSAQALFKALKAYQFIEKFPGTCQGQRLEEAGSQVQLRREERCCVPLVTTEFILGSFPRLCKE